MATIWAVAAPVLAAWATFSLAVLVLEREDDANGSLNPIGQP
jgi:hypothetical protein